MRQRAEPSSLTNRQSSITQWVGTANRLVRVVGPAGTTTYEYSGDGDRVAETHDGVASSLTQVLAETTNGQTITYLYGLGLVAQSSIEYHLTDGLGSVRQLADPGGQVLLTQTFDPYGNLYQQTRGGVLWDAASPFGWTGQQADANGLTYLRARYYAPGMGRFTQIDPFGGALSVPASMNGYGYGHGNPVRYTDPSGEVIPFIVAAIVGSIIIGAITAGTYDVMINQDVGLGGAHQGEFNQVNWTQTGFYSGFGGFVGLEVSVCAINPLSRSHAPAWERPRWRSASSAMRHHFITPGRLIDGPPSLFCVP